MRRFMTLLGLALLAYALLPTAAQAQVIYVQPARTYVTPIVIAQPVVPTYYYAAPSVTTYSSSASYSYYPPATYSYYPPATTVYSYSASPTVVTYSAPPSVVVPAAGVITTRTYYGYGIFRPRGYYSESYYTPLR
jgi:hypothetical protein